MGKKGGDKMKVTRIRAGVFRLEATVDEELELHEIAASQEMTIEETISGCLDIGINNFPISENDGE